MTAHHADGQRRGPLVGPNLERNAMQPNYGPLTSERFQSLSISERHEVLDQMTPLQMCDFAETLKPKAGVPVGAEPGYRSLALRLAIELRDQILKHEQPEAAAQPCECCVSEPEYESCDGTGDNHADPEYDCPTCGGTGIEVIPANMICEACDGTGKQDTTTQSLEAMTPADLEMTQAAKGWEG